MNKSMLSEKCYAEKLTIYNVISMDIRNASHNYNSEEILTRLRL